jgi:hypothetical protein
LVPRYPGTRVKGARLKFNQPRLIAGSQVEKFSLVSEINAGPDLPIKCCAHCTHGRSRKDPLNLRTMIECYEGPPHPVLVGTPQGVQIQSLHPVMAPESDCDRFSLKSPDEKPT